MADIIVRQANTTSLTIQSSSNQVLVRQQPNNTVVVQTTGNSYVLPPATANTLGGIIVGDNLTINANGLLSAQAGGVSTFNNRTGNVTLTANDVSAVGNALYFPLSTVSTIISGTSNVPGSIHLFGDGNGTSNPRINYGMTRRTDIPSVYGGNSTTTSYLGVLAGGITAGVPIYGIYNATPNRTDGYAFTQSDLSTNSIFTTAKFANNTVSGQSYILCDYQRISFGFYSSTAFSDMYFDTDGAQFFCIIKATNNPSPTSMEVLTRGAADALYEKIARRN
jgi:hypothetical protein